jgi:hypothetical protein
LRGCGSVGVAAACGVVAAWGLRRLARLWQRGCVRRVACETCGVWRVACGVWRVACWAAHVTMASWLSVLARASIAMACTALRCASVERFPSSSARRGRMPPT